MLNDAIWKGLIWSYDHFLTVQCSTNSPHVHLSCISLFSQFCPPQCKCSDFAARPSNLSFFRVRSSSSSSMSNDVNPSLGLGTKTSVLMMGWEFIAFENDFATQEYRGGNVATLKTARTKNNRHNQKETVKMQWLTPSEYHGRDEVFSPKSKQDDPERKWQSHIQIHPAALFAPRGVSPSFSTLHN